MKNKYAVQENSPGRRAAAYWFIDGLPEIVFGLVLLIIGIYPIVFHQPNVWILLGWIVVVSLYFVILGKHRRILDLLKARITYPRTGYVRPPKDIPKTFDPNQEIVALGLIHRVDENTTWFRNHTFIIFFFGSFLMRHLPAGRWNLPSVMMGVALLIYLLNRDDVHTYSWRAVLPIALAGFIAAFLDLTPTAREYAPCVIGGVWLLVIGIWTLVGYLRANPKLDSGQEGRL